MRASIVVVLVLHATLAFADDDVSVSSDDVSISTSNSTETDDDSDSYNNIKPQSEADKKLFETCKDNDCNSTAWESSGQTQGDMLIPDGKNVTNRYGFSYLTNRWPSGKVIYELDTVLNAREKHLITYGITLLSTKTCVKFEKRTNQKGYVFITNKSPSCFATVGYTGEQNILNLNPRGCITAPLVVHEMMHTLGFLHEQSGYDRDTYVTILYENILTGDVPQFEKIINSDNFKLPYDYYSIMHYSRRAFSKNDKDTIVPKKAGFIDIIGNAVTMSATDIRRVNRMYNCPTGQ